MSRLFQHFDAAKELVTSLFPWLHDVRCLVGCPAINEARAIGDKRYYMHVWHYPKAICVHQDTEKLSDANIRGLFLHEFGHLLAGERGSEVDANMEIARWFDIRILYDENAVQYIEDQS